MLGHRLRRWANIIPTKTLQPLNHEYNRVDFFSEDCLSTKVLNLGTSNVILHMFIRTGVQFPTHSTPLSPKYDTNSGKIKLIGYRPMAGPNYEGLMCLI